MKNIALLSFIATIATFSTIHPLTDWEFTDVLKYLNPKLSKITKKCQDGSPITKEDIEDYERTMNSVDKIGHDAKYAAIRAYRIEISDMLNNLNANNIDENNCNFCKKVKKDIKTRIKELSKPDPLFPPHQ